VSFFIPIGIIYEELCMICLPDINQVYEFLLEQSKKLKSSVPQACDTEQEIDTTGYTEQSDETGTVVA
jgi:hypothetical protein